MTKTKLFEPLNADVPSTVPNSWKSLISQLENDFRLAVIQSDAPLMSDTLFRLSDLHWFFKESWDGKHKIPLPCSTAPLFKARGQLLKFIASLAKECHFKGVKESLSYNNPVDWVAGILFEGILWCGEGKNKTEGIKTTQGHNKALRSFENPYSREKYPHTWNLIQASIKWAESVYKCDFTKLWNEFLDAKSTATRELESPYFVPVEQGEDGQFYTVLSPKTRGKGKVLLSQAMFKNSFSDSKCYHAGGLKVLLGKPSGF
ncbi:hypothetical protein [Nostoc sp. CHAB 5715]|uniref:hypothetical protein n=1 Tax=Nostoc sp. CHAB 5715 TaxID=2780400 RepID=UPI001E37B80C|nr:hypothetical protein [Nostoc sp. CHAB 5715]MCC5620803.1 hypothetical protein [Nostoc sp. CHAB 5715]